MLWAGLGGRDPRSSEGSTLASLLGPDVATRHQGYTVAALTRCRLPADRERWPTGSWLCVPQTLGGRGLIGASHVNFSEPLLQGGSWTGTHVLNHGKERKQRLKGIW